MTAEQLGPPWDRGLRGAFERLEITSRVLESNPLGDPVRRPVYVYTPPEAAEDLCSIYVIQGITGQLDMWLNRSAFEATMIERVDALFSGEDVHDALVVFADAWTSLGGSQFINSTATGRYLDYLCDEVVPFVDERYPTAAHRDKRGITGKSSGGYGAMVVPMLRPDVFGGLATHAGDALFEVCYLPEFPETVRLLRDRFEGSYEVFFSRMRSSDHFDFDLYWPPLNSYAMAACYSPDEDRPGEVALPFDIATGRLIDDVWTRWLSWDPVRMVAGHADALRSMRAIYIDAGRSDEYFLDLGAQAFAGELDAISADYSFELFDGKHGGIQYRYPLALRFLTEALSRA